MSEEQEEISRLAEDHGSMAGSSNDLANGGTKILYSLDHVSGFSYVSIFTML